MLSSLPLFMASTTITVPYPLFFDYLLASSWTWFAICLATIATTLRPLRTFFLRDRLVSTLTGHSPSAIAISSSESESSSLSDKPSSPSISPCRSFKSQSRSKSTSALEKLHKNGEGFVRSGMEFLSSVLDADFLPTLNKIKSASELFHDHSSCEKTHHKPGPCAFLPAGDNRSSEVYNRSKLGIDADDCVGSRSGPGFHSQTLVQENGVSCDVSFKEKHCHVDDDVPSWLPSWAYSLCDPLQVTLSFATASSYAEDRKHNDQVPIEAVPCFEKQFGWDRLLESRLGSPWNSVAQCSSFGEKSSNVVKTWARHQKKLVKALDADALAFDVCSQKGLACTGNSTGKVSLWELGRKSYAKASISLAQPIVAVSMNSEQGATMVGSGKGVGLWDQRSPIWMSLGSESALYSLNSSHTLSALKSRESGLCIADGGNTLSMYDLRKLHGKPLYSGPVVNSASISRDSADEVNFNLLEKLTCNDADDVWDEDSVTSIGNGVEMQKGSSLLSKFASFMRVLPTSL